MKDALKVVMHDAGKKPQSLGKVAECMPSKMPAKIYPCLYIDAAQAPFLKEYEVDDDCTFMVTAKIIGHNLDESASYNRDEYRLEIRKIGQHK